MKFAHIFITFFSVVLYFYCTNAISTTKFSRYSPQAVRMSRKAVNSNRVADIVCFYAKNGRWPSYPRNWRPFVSDFARRIFAMTDANIKRYCQRILQTNYFNWAVAFQPSQKSSTSTIRPTLYYTTVTSQPPFTFPTFATYTPSTSTSTVSPSSPSTSTSTVKPTSTSTLYPSTSIATTKSSVTAVSTTTTTQAPTASGSGKANKRSINAIYLIIFLQIGSYSSGSYSSGSYSASGSATAALTSRSSISDKLIKLPSDTGMRSFRKSRNGDIVVKWTPGRMNLRQIEI
jgi:hypothetical protein